jgi:hypothetical protein
MHQRSNVHPPGAVPRPRVVRCNKPRASWNLSDSKEVLNKQDRATEMPKPNTDPLLEPQRRKKKPTKPGNERGDNEKSSKAEAPAVDTLLKGTPPHTSTRPESPRGEPN